MTSPYVVRGQHFLEQFHPGVRHVSHFHTLSARNHWRDSVLYCFQAPSEGIFLREGALFLAPCEKNGRSLLQCILQSLLLFSQIPASPVMRLHFTPSASQVGHQSSVGSAGATTSTPLSTRVLTPHVRTRSSSRRKPKLATNGAKSPRDCPVVPRILSRFDARRYSAEVAAPSPLWRLHATLPQRGIHPLRRHGAESWMR